MLKSCAEVSSAVECFLLVDALFGAVALLGFVPISASSESSNEWEAPSGKEVAK